MHIDAYYGCAGLYLLPESSARSLAPSDVDNIGDWPISTDWIPSDDYSLAFAQHWHRWDEWFHENLDAHDKDRVSNQKFRGLLQTACEAMRAVEAQGILDSVAKTNGFKIIIAEHDEPKVLSLERYELFCQRGIIRCHDEFLEIYDKRMVEIMERHGL